MSEWGFAIDVRLPCADLTVEQRQIVEIARALAAGTRCLLLDEPTAALERGAIERLFARVRQLAASGVAILYISHHLEEVFEICQDVAVLRDGELVLARPAAELTKDDLVRAMIGPHVGATRADLTGTGPGALSGPEAGPGDVASRSDGLGPGTGNGLVVDNVSAELPGGRVSSVSLGVRPGERVGLTGLLSAGVSSLARIAAGAEPYTAGQVLVDGHRLVPGRRDLALRLGVGYIPEDRQRDGFVAPLGVAENATMTITDWLATMLGFVRPRARAAAAAPFARGLSIISAGLGPPVAERSGGNQQ
jgi:simple sugar transport system ATP-binding protein